MDTSQIMWSGLEAERTCPCYFELDSQKDDIVLVALVLSTEDSR